MKQLCVRCWLCMKALFPAGGSGGSADLASCQAPEAPKPSFRPTKGEAAGKEHLLLATDIISPFSSLSIFGSTPPHNF